MFCRKCDYPLRDASGDACPECGCAFDPDKRRTFRKRPRSKWPRRLRRAVLVLLVLYVGSYLWLVRASDSGPPYYWGRWRPIDVNSVTIERSGVDDATADHLWRLERLNRPLLWHEEPCKAEYVHVGDWANTLFTPANKLDRQIRKDHWTHFGCERELLPLIREVEKLRPVINQSPSGQADLEVLDFLNQDQMILAMGTPTWRQWTAKIAAHLKGMIARYE